LGTRGQHDERATPETVGRVLDLRFSQKRVAFDPSDPEANGIAVTRGFTVVPGGALSGGQWANAKKSGLVLPAGKVTPSPKPFSPDGKPLRVIPSMELNEKQKALAGFAMWMASKTIKKTITVQFADDENWPFGGAFGPDGTLYINARRPLSDKVTVLDFLIHELGHYDGAHHLSEGYHKNLTRIGAELALALAEKPDSLNLIT
jgi:hypothetical protein